MLTKAQKKTEQFIRSYILAHNISPTIAEIASGIGIKSRGVVHRYLKALETEGVIRCLPKRHRNIELVTSPSAHHELRVLGTIAAGEPIEAIVEQELVSIQSLLSNAPCFALRVRGHSMQDDGILDNDIVICEKRDFFEKNDIVVALIDGSEATLKRIEYHGDKVTLYPSSSSHQPMTYCKSQVVVQGVFIGLVRKVR